MPLMSQAGMKKRQVIANSNRTMFIWIAAMSAVVGVCAVVGYFFLQNIIYNTKVATELDKTVNTLRDNNKVAPDLIDKVRALETNEALNSVKTPDEKNALQVILDALPADPNTLALGSSLQNKILADIPGIKLESLVVDPYNEASLDEEEGAGTLSFRMTVSSSDANSLKEFLLRMEKSVRVIDIDALTLERTDDKYTLDITGHAYYELGKEVKLTDKVVPVHEKK